MQTLKKLSGIILMFASLLLLLLTWLGASFAESTRTLLPLEKYAGFMAAVLYVCMFIYGYKISMKDKNQN